MTTSKILDPTRLAALDRALQYHSTDPSQVIEPATVTATAEWFFEWLIGEPSDSTRQAA